MRWIAIRAASSSWRAQDELAHRRFVALRPRHLEADGGEDLVEVVERSFDDRPSSGVAEQGGTGAKLRPLTVEAGTESSHAGDTEPGTLAKVPRDDSPQPGFPSSETAPHGAVRIEVTAGPDAGWWAELQAGRHLVGRARDCSCRHRRPGGRAVPRPADDRPWRRVDIVDVVQLAGRTPVASAASHIDVGDSRLDLGDPVGTLQDWCWE